MRKIRAATPTLDKVVKAIVDHAAKYTGQKSNEETIKQVIWALAMTPHVSGRDVDLITRELQQQNGQRQMNNQMGEGMGGTGTTTTTTSALDTYLEGGPNPYSAGNHPIANLNGDSIHTLIANAQKMVRAITATQQIIMQASPHGRNFQANADPEDYKRDREAHAKMVNDLHLMREAVMERLANLADQQDNGAR